MACPRIRPVELSPTKFSCFDRPRLFSKLYCRRIEMTTKRIGGAYGGKATNSQLTSCIAALAAHVTRRPVHFHATLETCMKMLGTRTPYTVNYEVGAYSLGVAVSRDFDCAYSKGSTTTALSGEWTWRCIRTAAATRSMGRRSTPPLSPTLLTVVSGSGFESANHVTLCLSLFDLLRGPPQKITVLLKTIFETK